MKKIIILTLVSLLVLPGLVLAANDVTVPQATNILLLGDGYTYVLSADSTFDSITVNESNISFIVSALSSVTLTSSNKQDFNVSLSNGYVTATKTCGDSSSTLVITVSSDAPDSYSITATPTGLCTAAGGGGGGSAGGGGGGAVPATPAIPATPATSENTAVPATPAIPATPADAAILARALGIARNMVKESANQSKISADVKEFKLTATAAQQTAMNNFMTYGISANTINLGEGERRAVLRDYLDTVKRSEVDWADVERITTGQKPINRNLKNEQAQVSTVLAAFKKVIGHEPNFKNSKEDLTWNTMMYRIRFTRDLTKEKQGITAFQAKFNRLPKSPLDWSTVRALGYVK